ncbi:MAG: response regulator [Deltaproteobacteria bacterium]|nr:response regulator [Deltaproteobacteria bacterium]
MNRSILQIEDNEANRTLVRRVLEARGYSVFDAEDGLSGIRKAQEIKPALILMDINIPGLDGYEAATRIKSIKELENTPIVAITASTMHGDRERCLSAGCIGYIQKPIDIKRFPEQIDEFLSGREESLSLEEERSHLKDYSHRLVTRLQEKVMSLEVKTQQLEAREKETEEIYLNVMASLTKAMEEKDSYTAGHSDRVTYYSVEIGKFMELGSDKIKVLTRAAKLHDIGKLVVDLSHINKPGKLDEEEWEQMRRHPEVGANILGPLGFLKEEVEIIRSHHERWDGTGYPNRVDGKKLNLLSCIVMAADSYDAMVSNRRYRARVSPKEAIAELERCKGSQYHPVVVDAFVEFMNRKGIDHREHLLLSAP